LISIDHSTYCELEGTKYQVVSEESHTGMIYSTGKKSAI
jgi:hypothetical protein